MSNDFHRITKAKDAERRRLRELPWLEKLEMLDRLRDRHLLLRRMRPEGPEARVRVGEAVGGSANGIS